MKAKNESILPPAMQSLAEQIGLHGGWVILRAHWNEATKDYDCVEESFDGENWQPSTGQYNTASVRFVGGPKNGKVEW